MMMARRGGQRWSLLTVLVAAAACALAVEAQGAFAQTKCSATTACPVETDCCSKFGYCGTGSAYCGTGCQHGPCAAIAASAAVVSKAQGEPSWTSFLTQARFQQFFPNRRPIYTYANLKAAGGPPYPGFATSGSLVQQKREMAAFLANVKQETGGLQYVEEIDQSNAYCDTSNHQYPCAPGKKYFGRGAIQLTWNYNYGACGAALNANLLANPGQVAQNGVLAFKTAVWFWMTQGPHNRILGGSFSGTIRAINGAIECNKPAGSVGHKQMLNRVQYYKNFCQEFNVAPGTDLTC